jgi:3',5'-nucleoside bisphosphate phosphatase
MAAMTSARGAALVDLHTHTLASDGGDRPRELVAGAAAAGVGVLAVTDHDTVTAVAEARAAGQGLGVEVARRGRHERNLAIGERLERLTGVGYGDAVQATGASTLSRAHFAKALIARSVVAGVAEAFDRYLSSGRPGYVPAPSVPVIDAVALADKAGGVAVLAHPGRLAEAERDRVLSEALEAGIDGIEVWHSQHDAGLRRSLAELAERRGLLATGGSDYHGRHKPAVHLGTGLDGNAAVPTGCLDALRARLATGGPRVR